MRNHTRVGKPPSSPVATSGTQRPTVPARLAGMAGSIIEWLRAGYPDDAPGQGYSPLLALNLTDPPHGPAALTSRQAAQIVSELGDGPADRIDIGIAITKATNQLPTQTQTHAITRALHAPHRY